MKKVISIIITVTLKKQAAITNTPPTAEKLKLLVIQETKRK